MSSDSRCKIKGCGRRIAAKGFCGAHYQRVRITGSANTQKPVGPTIHGQSTEKTETYVSWRAMRRRCKNKRDKNFASYGERGIRVCKRWDDFRNFFKDMGERPKGLSLERIKNNKGYFPSNCKWATPKEQSRNRRGVKLSVKKAAVIRDLCSLGKSRKYLSKKFSVCRQNIDLVVNGIRWTE